MLLERKERKKKKREKWAGVRPRCEMSMLPIPNCTGILTCTTAKVMSATWKGFTCNRVKADKQRVPLSQRLSTRAFHSVIFVISSWTLQRRWSSPFASAGQFSKRRQNCLKTSVNCFKTSFEKGWGGVGGVPRICHMGVPPLPSKMELYSLACKYAFLQKQKNSSRTSHLPRDSPQGRGPSDWEYSPTPEGSALRRTTAKRTHVMYTQVEFNNKPLSLNTSFDKNCRAYATGVIRQRSSRWSPG